MNWKIDKDKREVGIDWDLLDCFLFCFYRLLIFGIEYYIDLINKKVLIIIIYFIFLC